MNFNFFRKNKEHSSDIEDVERILNENTPFAVREAYRALCTNVLYLPIPDKCKKLVITSAFPGEGKTSTSINLAITLSGSSEHRRVLVVDADMRKSRVMRLLKNHKFSSTSGLSEYLAGIDEKPNILSTDFDNLYVIPSGAEALNPTGLLNSSRMKDLVASFEDKFDYVIFDTPPVNVVSDALVLSELVNGYFIVARADYSDVNSLSQAVDTLKQVQAEVYGIVLNSVDVKKRGYSRAYSKYGHSYYSNNTEKGAVDG